MKIKRKNLNRLINYYLNESKKRLVKEVDDDSSDDDFELPEPDDFELTPEDDEGYTSSIDAYHHPEKTSFPKLFRSELYYPHEPDPQELEHVRYYQQNTEIDPEGREFSVHDKEITIPNIAIQNSFEDEDTDEDTEESPFGTQYSLEDTHEIPDYDNIEFDDDSQDVFTYEDEFGNEKTFLRGKEVTPSSGDEKEGMITRIRKYLGI